MNHRKNDKRGQRQRKKTEDIRWGRPVFTTGVMILLIVAASFCVIRYINDMEEEKCFDRLYEEADGLAEQIEMRADNDGEELEMLSEMIAKYDDLSSEELWSLLDSYTSVGMMSRLEILLPGDQVIVRGGERIDAAGILSFEKEAMQGVHITNRETDILDSENYIVRHYVPVVRNGETIAMLYGIIELGELPEMENMNPYGGEGAMYIIDGSTGDFLVDTWHTEEGGNMWEMGQREMAPGYDPDQMKQGVIDGDSRYVVFVSRTVGEYLYFYYQPMAINQWRIAVSVPESVVFESANEIGRILNAFLLFELACFILYFLWIIRHVRHVTGEKQHQLETINNIYDVEKLLFNAHEKEENIGGALEKIGRIMTAEKVNFRIVEKSYENKYFYWEKETGTEKKEKETAREDFSYIQNLVSYFEAGNSQLELYDAASVREMFPDIGDLDIHNLAAVSVEDMEGNLCGILESCNMADRHASAAILKSMKFSFSMFCSNLKSYTEIREQSERDALTGLLNRNRYERDLPSIYSAHRNALACIYIDVNGLHELNNTKGHDKGDKMLQAVAEGIRLYFHTEYMYRIGGDEFIVFLPDEGEEDVKLRGRSFSGFLEEEGYHISVGIQCERDVVSMTALVKAAEKKMYAEKKKYYEREENDRRRSGR